MAGDGLAFIAPGFNLSQWRGNKPEPQISCRVNRSPYLPAQLTSLAELSTQKRMYVIAAAWGLGGAQSTAASGDLGHSSISAQGGMVYFTLSSLLSLRACVITVTRALTSTQVKSAETDRHASITNLTATPKSSTAKPSVGNTDSSSPCFASWGIASPSSQLRSASRRRA